MTAIVGVHGVGNYVPGQPAEIVAARRSADWTANVATGLGIRPGALDLTVAYYSVRDPAERQIAHFRTHLRQSR